MSSVDPKDPVQGKTKMSNSREYKQTYSIDFGLLGIQFKLGEASTQSKLVRVSQN